MVYAVSTVTRAQSKVQKCRNVKTACGCAYKGYSVQKMKIRKDSDYFKKVIRIFDGVKFLKKVILKFFGQMCSGEFFLKHALSARIWIYGRNFWRRVVVVGYPGVTDAGNGGPWE